MKRNRVRFQKGFSQGKFLQRYGSQGQCKSDLFSARPPGGFRWPDCGSGRNR